jgi:agmatinase
MELTRTQTGPWLPDEEIPVTHGSYFWYAAKEGLLAPHQANVVRRPSLLSSVCDLTVPVQHVGIRNAIGSWADYEDDAKVGFHIVHAEDIEDAGYRGIVKRIRDVVGTNPVYSTLRPRPWHGLC